MAFHNSLKRLRAAVDADQTGSTTMVTVLVRDVRELLYHFDRLDEDARQAHARDTKPVTATGSLRR